MTETAPFPVDSHLQGLSIAYRNTAQNFIADKLMPRTPVATKSFKYLTFDQAQHFTLPDTKVGRKSEPTIVEYVGEETSATVLDYGLEDIIPIDDIEQASAAQHNYDPKARAVEFLTDLILLDRERRVAQIIQDADNYLPANATNIGNASTDKWTHSSKNPRDLLLTALDVPILRPNVMVIGREAWTKIRQHPKLVSSVARAENSEGAISKMQLADLLEIKQVLVGDSIYNSANRGQDLSRSYTWGKNLALLHINEAAGAHNGITWGYSAEYGKRSAGIIPDPNKGARGAIVVRVIESCCEVVAAKSLGVLFKNIVA